MMTSGSELRSEVLKYVAGAEVPKSQFMNPEVSNQTFNFEHFSIPVGYSKIFTDKVKFNIQHLVGNEKIDGINTKLMKDIIESRHHLENDNWGYFKKLNAVGFFDFNADGVKDIAMIGETDFGTNILLVNALPNGPFL